MRRSGNSWASSVLDFHRELARGPIGYTAIKTFILALNTSLPNFVSHAKFLMLLSLLHNSDIAPYASAALTNRHRRALTDPILPKADPLIEANAPASPRSGLPAVARHDARRRFPRHDHSRRY